ncbi:hypothetical protein [Nostoc sp. 106C]|uniref:hypothetical protein n=1 Tax=Nostoc sp. 106C TaxID=1932667 RepID=UPI001412588A|nr:hypothetical protein [Nostoc sp. 106C]
MDGFPGLKQLALSGRLVRPNKLLKTDFGSVIEEDVGSRPEVLLPANYYRQS